MDSNQFLDFLKTNNIAYSLYQHPKFYTVEEGEYFHNTIPGGNSKNLFLKDKKKNFFLLSILSYKRVDLKSLSKSYGRGGLSFANENDLQTLLGLTPGSVTPYGLINDEGNQVKFLLDQEFQNYDLVNFHPLQNDLTIGVVLKDFLQFCELVSHEPEWIHIG